MGKKLSEQDVINLKKYLRAAHLDASEHIRTKTPNEMFQYYVGKKEAYYQVAEYLGAVLGEDYSGCTEVVGNIPEGGAEVLFPDIK